MLFNLLRTFQRPFVKGGRCFFSRRKMTHSIQFLLSKLHVISIKASVRAGGSGRFGYSIAHNMIKNNENIQLIRRENKLNFIREYSRLYNFLIKQTVARVEGSVCQPHLPVCHRQRIAACAGYVGPSAVALNLTQGNDVLISSSGALADAVCDKRCPSFHGTTIKYDAIIGRIQWVCRWA